MVQTHLPDGSKLVIAAFDNKDGKSLAMLDFRDVPEIIDRTEVQSGLRKIIEMQLSGI